MKMVGYVLVAIISGLVGIVVGIVGMMAFIVATLKSSSKPKRSVSDDMPNSYAKERMSNELGNE